MDANNVVAASTVVLVCITAYYAVVTHRLASESKRANEFQREAFERQQRTTIYPQMFCSVTKAAGDAFLTVYNAGDNPAYDVDLIVVTGLDATGSDVATFTKAHILPKHQAAAAKILEDLMEDLFFGIFDHFVYAVFPPHRQVKVPLERSLEVDSVHVLLQFRDGTGSNYGQYYWFFGGDSPNCRLTLGSVQPTGVKVLPRIDYDGVKRLAFESETGVVPREFAEIAELFASSIPSGWTKAGRAGVEDPGDWSDL